MQIRLFLKSLALVALICTTSMATPKPAGGCIRAVLGFAGYYGIGPYAFAWRDPMWSEFDASLVKPLAWRATVFHQNYPNILELREDLQKLGPWKNPAELVSASDPMSEQAAIGYVSAASQLQTPSGKSLPFRLRFLPYTDSGRLTLKLNSQTQLQYFSETYAAWLENLGDLPPPLLFYTASLEKYLSTPGAQIDLRFGDEKQLRRYLHWTSSRFNAPNPLLTNAIYELLRNLQKASPPTIDPQLLNWAPREITIHLLEFYYRSLSMVQRQREQFETHLKIDDWMGR